MNLEEIALQLVLHGGNARAIAYEAVDAARAGEFGVASAKLHEAGDELAAGKESQFKLIHGEVLDGATFLLVHAQDHIMTAQAELQLCARLVEALRDLVDVKNRLAKIEDRLLANGLSTELAAGS